MSNRRAHQIHLGAIGVTALISAAYLVVHVYEGSGPSQTVVQSNGSWVIALLLAPLAFLALPLVMPPDRRRTAVVSAAAALTLFALITGFTIGAPYLLPAAVMWVAVAIERAPGPRSGAPLSSGERSSRPATK